MVKINFKNKNYTIIESSDLIKDNMYDFVDYEKFKNLTDIIILKNDDNFKILKGNIKEKLLKEIITIYDRKRKLNKLKK
jgi:hypothetical protein